MICELRSNNTRGASWGDDGTIVFAEADAGGLWRVSSGGGTPEALTPYDPEQGEQRWPEVLPGGAAVLFTSVRGGINNAQIAVLSLATGAIRILIPSGANPHYVPTGHIVYGVAGTLRAVAFDLERLEVTSDPISVLEGPIVSKSGGLDIAVAQDGSLAYITDTPSRLDKNSVWVDRQGREERLAAPARLYLYLRLSPDGTRIALDIRTPGEDVWVWDLAGETLTRLSLDPGADISPIWTPDGGRIVFASGRPNNLVWTAADGTGSVEPLAASTNQQRAQTFSPDGKHLIFWERHPDRGYDLHRLSLDGERSTAPLLATEFNEMNAEISPDGRFLAYQSDESGRNEIYVRPFPNIEQGKRQVSTDLGYPLSAPRNEISVNADVDRTGATSLPTLIEAH